MNTPNHKRCRRRRQRGSVYIMILITSMLAIGVGLSGWYGMRLKRRVRQMTDDITEARCYAISALDHGLFLIQQNPSSWRSLFAANGGWPIQDRTIGRGTHSLRALDRLDGDLNNGPDPVELTATGTLGQATYKLGLQLDGNGSPVPGSWRRVVQ